MNPVLRASAAHLFVESLDHPQLTPGDDHHARRVLRVRPREVVTLSDGRGSWQAHRLLADGVEPVGERFAEDAPRRSCVVSAIPKGDRVDTIVTMLTEIGVTEIVLAAMDRSVVRWSGDRLARQRVRLGRIMLEAAMQSRRVWLPSLVVGEPWSAVLDRPDAALADADGERDVCTSCVIVGPEGGFSDAERDVVVPRVALGPQILRVETAAVVAGARLVARPQ